MRRAQTAASASGLVERIVRMALHQGRSENRSIDRRLSRDRLAGLIASGATMLALAVAAPAWAVGTGSATATVAPIGSASATSSYLVTVNNTGSENITALLIGVSQEGLVGSSIVPSDCQDNVPVAGAIGCPGIVAGASEQLCYTGPPAVNISATFPEAPLLYNQPTTTAAGVASCPVAGFTLPSGGGSTPEGGSSGGRQSDPAGDQAQAAEVQEGVQEEEGPRQGQVRQGQAQEEQALTKACLDEGGRCDLEFLAGWGACRPSGYRLLRGRDRGRCCGRRSRRAKRHSRGGPEGMQGSRHHCWRRP